MIVSEHIPRHRTLMATISSIENSKLTRILQPALGNAKISIICTVAPKEVHVEETKGTLQFIRRAKRITNYVQVNEGSHAGGAGARNLELRNDMLKHGLEHEKLDMELEEERKSHIEQEQCSREHQMKNGSSDSEGISTRETMSKKIQVIVSIPQLLNQLQILLLLKDLINLGHLCIPGHFKMNLDCSIDNHKEVENLRMQLQQAIDERNEFESFEEDDDKSPTSKLISTTNEVVKSIMSTLEAEVSVAINGYRKRDNLEDEIGNSENYKNYKDCTLETQIASWKTNMSDENNHLIQASKARIHGLEKESQILLEERMIYS
ncbi:hypothetical protein LXL04_023182 [Taraxacum kok-saghyz]